MEAGRTHIKKIMKLSIKRPAEFALTSDEPSFVLVGMMRSGSNFVERRLNQLSSVRCHGELFNPKFIGFASDFGDRYLEFKREEVWPRNKDSLGFLKQVLASRDRTQCGFRMFLDHDPAIMSEVIFNPRVKKVVLTRNLLDSFISLLIARETDVWLTTHAAKPDKVDRVSVDPDELVQFAMRQSMFYNDVLTILHRTNQPYFHIDYSEIKSLPRLNAMADFLGVSERFADNDEPIQRQNPAEQRDKVTNYTELVEALRERSMARWFI